MRTEKDVAVFRIVLHNQGVKLTRALGDAVQERLRRDLRPYAGRIVVAHVRLWMPSDADGPAVCHVRVELRPSGGLALGETGSDAAAAVERASLRMASALRAQLARPPAVAPNAWFRT